MQPVELYLGVCQGGNFDKVCLYRSPGSPEGIACEDRGGGLGCRLAAATGTLRTVYGVRLMRTKNTLGGIVVSRPARSVVHSGLVFGISLMSDLHIGAAHVDYRLISKEVSSALSNGDRLLINGDILDLILVQDRKRFSPDVLADRLQGRRDIVNEAIEWAVEILSPAAHLIDMIGLGNHEVTVEKYCSTDPLSIIVHALRKESLKKDPEHIVHYGGYTGFVDYRFELDRDTHTHKPPGCRYVIYYHHGGGAYAPVTKGMIDFNRKDTFVDADLLWLGHKHNRWNAHVEKLSCPESGYSVRTKQVRHVMTGAYFQSYVGQSQKSIGENGRRSNYAADAGLAPQGKGGARVLLEFYRNGVGTDRTLRPDVRVVQ